MATDDLTPVERPRADGLMLECPHCRVKRKVTAAGLFELHPKPGKWFHRTKSCRGSGQKAI